MLGEWVSIDAYTVSSLCFLEETLRVREEEDVSVKVWYFGPSWE